MQDQSQTKKSRKTGLVGPLYFQGKEKRILTVQRKGLIVFFMQTLSPIPNVNRILNQIVSCSDFQSLQDLNRAPAMQADLKVLAPQDLATVKSAALAKRVTLALYLSGLR